MIRMGAQFGLLAAAALALVGCASTREERDFETQFTLAEAALAKDIQILASDEFLGRRPGTEGEVKTLDFIERELSNVGFVSGTNDPSNPWRAPVRLVRTAAQSGSITISLGEDDVKLSDQEAAVLTKGNRALVEGAKLVYVGKAEAGAESEAVAGQVAILEGEPGKSPARRAKLFEQGALSVITLVNNSAAINSLRSTSGRERFQLARAAGPSISAFVSREAMIKVIPDWADKAATLEELQRANPTASMPVEATVRIEANSDRREVISMFWARRLRNGGCLGPRPLPKTLQSRSMNSLPLSISIPWLWRRAVRPSVSLAKAKQRLIPSSLTPLLKAGASKVVASSPSNSCSGKMAGHCSNAAFLR